MLKELCERTVHEPWLKTARRSSRSLMCLAQRSLFLFTEGFHCPLCVRARRESGIYLELGFVDT